MEKQVFKDLKILEFTTAGIGPITGKYFADYGATVLRVESSSHPDLIRLSPPYKPGAARINASSFWTQYNTGKLSISLNLNRKEGKEVAKQLVNRCDIVIENFAAGVMDRLDLGYEDLIKVNPTLIMIGMTNMGRTGPCAQHPGLGQPLQALSGLVHLLGWPDRGPCNPFGAAPDLIAPPFAVTMLIAALDYRERTGQGQFIDLSQFETSCQMLAPLFLDFQINGREANRAGNRAPDGAPHGIYPCLGEDRWCAIAIFSEEEWTRFCQVIGQSELAVDSRFKELSLRKKNEDELNEIVSRWTGTSDSQDCMNALQQAGVGAAVVNTPADLFQDLQLQHRRHFNWIDHTEIGPHRVIGQCSILSETPARIKRAPLMGEHNELILRDFLEMSEEDYAKLLVNDIIE